MTALPHGRLLHASCPAWLEVLSPSTRRLDLLLKSARYAAVGDAALDLAEPYPVRLVPAQPVR